MTRTLLVIFDGEVLRPQEPVDLEPNARYRVSIEEVPAGDASPHEPGVFDNLLELAQALDLPPDFAAQVDHYLYGVPKR